ncbi:MAG: hypothetical protein MJ252_00865 [archaeon]|nr:hypothetical protein [archaeon]
MSRIQFYLILSIIAVSLCTKCNDPLVADDYRECMDRDKVERGEVCCKYLIKIIIL